ncbi:MAG: hypothetical protein CVU39_22920 [Chloroflexi bacterium HGW-Chloroflexi-10]|nr:MAG: hypothetical protein CVU39_22920 [Chloroflexi bacterium HGW-Chloroflexi-10]
MRKWRWFFIPLILITLVMGSQPLVSIAAAPPPPQESDLTGQAAEPVDEALTLSLQKSLQTVAKSKTEVLAFVMYDPYIDHVIYSEDGLTALLWLGLHDPETGEVIAAEPGLAIAKTDVSQKSLGASAQWDITLQADGDWQQTFTDLPAEMVNEDLKTRFFAPAEAEAKDVKTVYRGYKLPWAGGTMRRLSGSIGHFLIYYSCPETSCRYAYDFADGTMFPLLASRGGTVHKFATECPNYNTGCNNYLVLKDESTSPTTYQLYLHMAYDSIPDSLRSVGAQVKQGQYIGNVDDTGYSSGHHLHFHVHTNATAYWGNSVDIRFDEVDINDGTPRTCNEVANFPNYGTQCNPATDDSGKDWFVSENYGANPPSGDLVVPGHGEVVTDSSLLIGGWANDDLGIQKIQIIARARNSTWVNVGPVMNQTTFMTTLDLCSSGLPNGPIELAVKIYDIEGNPAVGLPGMRTIINNATCKQLPPPTCSPNANQVALFGFSNHRGPCKLFDVGNYKNAADWGDLGDNNVESVLVGSNVRALLYDNTQSDSFDNGRSEALEGNDANLADNRINADYVSALQVQLRSTAPRTPVINTIFNDIRRQVASNESYVIDFYGYGATQYRANLTGPVNKSLNWTNQNGWSVGSLPAGNYTVQVWGRNSAGESSASKAFSVASAALPTSTTVNAPVTFDFESGAQGWNFVDMWHLESFGRNNTTVKTFTFNQNYLGDGSLGLGDANIGGGDLTSPPIRIPAGNPHYLRFDYFYETESMYSFWDQRWVQISVDGGQFENILQLHQDPKRAWLTSPTISLAAYAGHTIRIRFHMDIVDPYHHGDVLGWVVDSVSITTTAPPACLDVESNNSIAQAGTVNSPSQVAGYICPSADLDYYKFSGTAGEVHTLDVDAMEIGSALDPYLFLYDSSGNLLTENDDELLSVQRDSKITFTLPQSGDYYAMVRAWNHPGVGDGGHFYFLKFTNSGDSTPPAISFASPSAAYMPMVNFTVRANASDSGSGVKQVDFYWHSADRVNGSWIALGSDSNGADGWTASFNPANYGPVIGGMLYIQAFDNAGNQNGALLIPQGVDTQVPTSQMNPLPSTNQSTLVNLTWSASDPENALDHYDIQFKTGSESTWQHLQTVAANRTNYPFLGEFGKAYSFRMRAVDQSGNAEAFPANNAAEATTTIAPTCTPGQYEPLNNTSSNATVVPVETSQQHKFCSTADIDWVQLNVEAGKKYLIFVTSRGGGAAMKVKLYQSASLNMIKSYTPSDFGQSVMLTYEATQNETLFLEITPLDNRLAGDGVLYNIWYGKGYDTFMPVIYR